LKVLGKPIEILSSTQLDSGLAISDPSLTAVPNDDSSSGYAYLLFFSTFDSGSAKFDIRYATSLNGVTGGEDGKAASGTKYNVSENVVLNADAQILEGMRLDSPGKFYYSSFILLNRMIGLKEMTRSGSQF
jgi:hypothetical protein